ncbi:transposase [Thioalkalivibrio sp. HK1]|uniref:transposase n=1 Tax=Thioalkalivibrio sp. HK1 TaxID=1469245 RepID=UPI000470AC3B|nr:transposase [Thioalkalivibrio sp. HK1]
MPEFFERFPDEASARAFIEKRLWKDGKPTCPKCKSQRHGIWKSREGYYRCKGKGCRKVYSVKHGTIFHASKIPLRSWLYVFYLWHVSRKGISSVQLSRQLGIMQPSAWHMLLRVRQACSGQLAKLSGEVEMDATYIGGKEG